MKADILLIVNFYLSNDVDDVIIVDVHFQQSTMVKYRTNLEFDWLDLMG